MYYLNVLAGPGGKRSMAYSDDPAHHWVRDDWSDMPLDPRCPMVTPHGKTDPGGTWCLITSTSIANFRRTWLNSSTSRGTSSAPDMAGLPTCRAAIAGSSRWDAERMDQAPELKVISRSGIGFDTVDLDAAAARGIVVCNTPDAPTISTAEHTMSLLLAATKFTANNVARLRQGRQDSTTAAHEGIELSGATVGVVGHGRIGSRVARMCAAMDMRGARLRPLRRGHRPRTGGLRSDPRREPDHYPAHTHSPTRPATSSTPTRSRGCRTAS